MNENPNLEPELTADEKASFERLIAGLDASSAVVDASAREIAADIVRFSELAVETVVSSLNAMKAKVPAEFVGVVVADPAKEAELHRQRQQSHGRQRSKTGAARETVAAGS